MNNTTSLEFSTTQKQVSGIFYNNSKNGIIIYTEDTDNEHDFYIHFYDRLLQGTDVKVDKVIQLGTCDDVKDCCDNDVDFSIPKLYVIDGDIYQTYKPKNEEARLFVLDRYCIENYLVDEETVCHTVQHFKTLKIDYIQRQLNYDKLMEEFAKCMVPVYYYYSILSEENKKNRDTKTAGFSFTNFESLYDMQSDTIRESVMNSFIHNSRQELLQLPNITDDYINLKLKERETQFPISITSLLKIVSGKDDLIPFIRKKTSKIFGFSEPDLTTWKFNSADYFDVSSVQRLRDKIVAIYADFLNEGNN